MAVDAGLDQFRVNGVVKIPTKRSHGFLKDLGVAICAIDILLSMMASGAPFSAEHKDFSLFLFLVGVVAVIALYGGSDYMFFMAEEPAKNCTFLGLDPLMTGHAL